jgi:hypothetical protein
MVKKGNNESKKGNFGCAKATNFELEIEDRGHLADYGGVEEKKRGDQGGQDLSVVMMSYSSLQVEGTLSELEPDDSESGAGLN